MKTGTRLQQGHNLQLPSVCTYLDRAGKKSITDVRQLLSFTQPQSFLVQASLPVFQQRLDPQWQQRPGSPLPLTAIAPEPTLSNLCSNNVHLLSCVSLGYPIYSGIGGQGKRHTITLLASLQRRCPQFVLVYNTPAIIKIPTFCWREQKVFSKMSPFDSVETTDCVRFTVLSKQQ